MMPTNPDVCSTKELKALWQQVDRALDAARRSGGAGKWERFFKLYRRYADMKLASLLQDEYDG